MPNAEICRIQEERRGLESNLIDVIARLDHLTPQTLTDHLAFRQYSAVWTYELRRLEADREAIQKKIALLDERLRKLQQHPRPTKGPSSAQTKQKMIFGRVSELQNQNPQKTKNELISIVADELDMNDQAVHERYYKQQKKEIEMKSKRKKAPRIDSGIPEKDEKRE